MRHESCTVVALVIAAMPGASGPGEASPGTGRYGTIPAGTGSTGPSQATVPPGVVAAPAQVAEPLLAELGSSANVSVVRPPTQAGDAVESAALALRQAAHRSSPFALVPADPLAAVATQWQAMWDLSRGGRTGAVLFDEQAARAVAAWHGRHFELPDYYLVLAAAAGNTQGSAGPDFYLGPLRAVRPHRVVVVAASDGPEQAAGVRDALRSLRHGPWWPPLDELLDTARRFFAGGLAEAGTSLATGPR
jgi:hypothetical protein